MGWWEERRREGLPGALRVVTVEDDAGLVGIAPFYADASRARLTTYRLVAAGNAHRLGPLCRPGHEAAVAKEVARGLAAARPRPRLVRFDLVDASSPWPEAIAGQWPANRRTRVAWSAPIPAPVLELSDQSYDQWLATKSHNFREQARNGARRLERAGAEMRLVREVEELERVVDALLRMHEARWAQEGTGLDAGAAWLLCSVGRELMPSEAFRLFYTEIDGAVVAATLFAAGGGELVFFLTGYDPRWAYLRPGFHLLLAGIRDSFERGERRVDLGQTAHEYKLRITEALSPIASAVLVPPGRGSAMLGAWVRSRYAAQTGYRRLPARWR